jgi:hypothetical protein
MMRRILFAWAAAMLAAPMDARSQTPSGVVLSGRVSQAGDTTVSVGGAEVEIVGTGIRRYANGEGRFVVADILPGSYELRVRRIGYESASLRVVLEEGRSSQQNIELRRHPNALAEVRIKGRMVKVPARFEQVFARAAKGEGTFFFREDIDKLNSYDVRSLLNLVPTVYINDRTITFERCKEMSKGISAKVQVYIDGTRVTASTSTGVLEAIRLVHVKNIEVMEVYTGVARIPAEFLNDACAVIAIWTKSY